ncbi:MAG: preprotein translocase subunit SecY [Candidatus Aenigmarchaeota archaeon]|nr:preprotein translocase subunit SecY [Candidatus Aenigmarchaeota archaeon]
MLDKLGKMLPAIEEPKYALKFRTRLMWIGIILILFLVMGQIPLYGVAPETYERFKYMQLVLASKMGTLMTLGISPIVMASIILQLLVGAKILPLDLTKPEDRIKFQDMQKIVTVLFCIFEGTVYVLFGVIKPGSPDIFTILLLIAQLSFGGFLVLLMDEVIHKWGVGSGISLFIAAGVSQTIFVRALNPFTMGAELPAGAVPRFITALGIGEIGTAIDAIIPVIATVIVFLIVVYVQGIKVEIPLAFGSLSGFGRRWPLKFIYTSNIPVILTAALLANFHLFGTMIHNPWIAQYDSSGNVIGGLLYYLSMPRGLILSIIHGTITTGMILQAIGYVLFMAIGATLFSILWIYTSGMDPRSVAEQIKSIGFQIPGFRRDPRIIEQVLARYIPPLALMGGLFVGLLAAFADFTGALGTGTGILLTVMIIYNFYEEISRRYVEEMHPELRKFFGR